MSDSEEDVVQMAQQAMDLAKVSESLTYGTPQTFAPTIEALQFLVDAAGESSDSSSK